MKKIIVSAVLVMSTMVYADGYTMAPDGSYVGGSSSQLAPDGTYIGY